MTQLIRYRYLSQFEMTGSSALSSIIPPYLDLDRAQGSSIVLRLTGYSSIPVTERDGT